MSLIEIKNLDIKQLLQKLKVNIKIKGYSFFKIKRENNIFDLEIKYKTLRDIYELQGEIIIEKNIRNIFGFKIKKKKNYFLEKKEFKNYSTLFEYIVRNFIEGNEKKD